MGYASTHEGFRIPSCRRAEVTDPARFVVPEVVTMPLVIPADVTAPELCEAIANLREMQKRAGLEVERAELQVEIDLCLDRMPK